MPATTKTEARERETASSGGRRSLRWLAYLAIAVTLTVVAAGAIILYVGATTSLRAEENLHATIGAIHVVEQFVYANERWPRSWQELEATAVPGDDPSPLNRYGARVNWPADSKHVQECVDLDFEANLEVIAGQDVADFNAVRSKSPAYEHADETFVRSLQETVREIVNRQEH